VLRGKWGEKNLEKKRDFNEKKPVWGGPARNSRGDEHRNDTKKSDVGNEKKPGNLGINERPKPKGQGIVSRWKKRKLRKVENLMVIGRQQELGGAG